LSRSRKNVRSPDSASPREWTLIVSGGGSGGHLFPALAVVEQLLLKTHRPSRILFLTADREIDQRILTSAEMETVSLPAIDSHQFRRRPLRSLWAMSRSILAARQLYRTLPSPVVLATGGYGSVPGGVAAWRNGIPMFLLEQNVVAGRATSCLSRLTRLVFTSFPDSDLERRSPKTTHWVGNPVRSEIAELIDHPYDPERRVLLVLGGSQGAKAINQALGRFAREHRAELSGWKIFHHTGITDAPAAEQVYRECGIQATVSPFFDNMPELYRQAGLVISRAGGTSLAELACAGVPGILVPYPNSLRDHQQKNADRFVQAGGAVCVPQTTPDFEQHLMGELRRLMARSDERVRMSDAIRSLARPNAAKEVAKAIVFFRKMSDQLDSDSPPE